MTHFLRMTGIQFTNCELSGFVNDLDRDMFYVVPEGKSITGVKRKYFKFVFIVP